MYESIQIPWSSHPTSAEIAYRTDGLVKTQGTIFLLPPPSDVLRSTFNTRHKGTPLSAGAKALCKHYEREGGSTEHGVVHPFWPLPTGSNERKSAVANEVLEGMLKQVVWRNVMLLHPGVAVYEIREGKGWGMRWTLDVVCGEDRQEIEDGAETGAGGVDGEWRIARTWFRGFLEPIRGLK